ncbi:unnamed protein product [Adineta steineri]|uniref:Nuclear receptor domain-containing protein n=1 Tax=Adineta steineri TaxID=433720 RepID=A0A816A6R4_9BILA|nr:unnamed protein product [Adineta steineri]CAF1594087.1 unnamed protein product [Adineta steineri]
MDSGNDKINSIPSNKNNNKLRNRSDLTCVVCQKPASGYNFAQISCGSCKEFFRRNALLPIGNFTCINKKEVSINNRCKIRYDMKQKCQHCRLLKCFESGMRKDHLITREEKLRKKQLIEENRRLRSKQNHIKCKLDNVSVICTLTDIDRLCLSHIKDSYISALRSTSFTSSLITFDESLTKTYSFVDLIEIEKNIPIRIINFLRLIPEFESLCEDDRLALAKYNIIPLLCLHDILVFDRKTELLYNTTELTTLSSNDKSFAYHYKSLCYLFYGYERMNNYISYIHTIINLIDNDTMIIQLLMLILIFLKGTTVNDEQLWLLSNPQNVFNAHLKYVDLLFRYLMDKFSFDIAVIKMIRLVENIFKLQATSQDFQQTIKRDASTVEIHPLMKTLLGMT